jgi:ketosteroid isomerase-like protein
MKSKIQAAGHWESFAADVDGGRVASRTSLEAAAPSALAILSAVLWLGAASPALAQTNGRLAVEDRSVEAPAAHVQTPGQEADARAAARGFKDALARGDSTAALGYLTDDVLILEGGRAETKAQYRSGHLAADIRFASSVRSETVSEGVTLHGDTAHYTQSYRVTGTSARGAPIDRTSSEAMVLVRTPAGWRIRSIHWF